MRKNYNVSFAGKSSTDYGLILKNNSALKRASQKYSKVSVPGRNGDIYFLEDAYNNYIQSYDIVAGYESNMTPAEAMARVQEWLDIYNSRLTIEDVLNLEVNGYHRLIDSFEPDVIRLAALTQGYEADAGRYSDTTVSFDCRPERFTSDAFTAISKTSSGGYVTNNGRPSKPCLKIYGSGEGTVTCNGYVITISSIPSYIYIDSDSQNCFKEISDANLNNLVTLTSGFPILDNGRNTITWTGGVTQVDVYPRWWNL